MAERAVVLGRVAGSVRRGVPLAELHGRAARELGADFAELASQIEGGLRSCLNHGRVSASASPIGRIRPRSMIGRNWAPGAPEQAGGEQGLVMLCVRVSPSLRRRLKLAAASTGRPVQALATEAYEAICRHHDM